MDEILEALEIIPPMDDTCPECAGRHKPDEPHDRNSLYYQMVYYRKHGTFPTWKDAMAHCAEEVKQEWEKKLKESGIPMG